MAFSCFHNLPFLKSSITPWTSDFIILAEAFSFASLFWHVSCLFSGVPLNLEIANHPPPSTPLSLKGTSSELWHVSCLMPYLGDFRICKHAHSLPLPPPTPYSPDDVTFGKMSGDLEKFPAPDLGGNFRICENTLPPTFWWRHIREFLDAVNMEEMWRNMKEIWRYIGLGTPISIWALGLKKIQALPLY